MILYLTLLVLKFSPVEPIQMMYISTTNFPPPYTQLGKTALSIRRNVKNYSDAIPTEATTYMGLVKTSKIFVDTSLFLKEILYDRHARTVLILAPSGWGKTINLDMVKTLTEFQVDENGKEIYPVTYLDQFKYFHRGEIRLSDDEVVKLETPILITRHLATLNQYLNRHPTIYVCFKDTIGENYADVERKIALAISKPFKEHEYMMKVFKNDMLIHKDNYEMFNQYLHPNLSNIDTELLVKSMRFLSKVLHRHFYNGRVVILIDDYDTPAHSYLYRDNFPSNDAVKISQFIKHFTEASFERNPFLETGIAMGKIKLAHCIGNFDLVHFVADEFDPLREYFGFKPQHLDTIFNKMKIDKNLSRKALDWCNKYDQSVLLKQSFYNPVSIVKFLKHGNIDNYWKANQSINYIDRALDSSPTLRQQMMLLINKQTVQSSVLKRSNIYDPGLSWTNENEISSFGEDLFYLYLLGEGYLVEVHEIPRRKTVKIPSNEVAHEIANWMIRYYQQQYHIRNATLYDTAFRLLHFLRTDHNSTLLVHLELETLYRISALELKRERETFVINEPFINSILNCVLLRTQCMSKFELEVYYDRVKQANFVIIDSELRRGTVIEYTYNQSSESACEAAEKYKHVFNSFIGIDEIVLIGLNFSPNRTLQISTKFVTTSS